MEDERGEDPVRKGLAMWAETTSDAVRYGEDPAWVLGNIGESRRRLTDTTKEEQRLAGRGCNQYECREGQAVPKASHWKIFE